ncbi:hypothetical protein SEVIR_7G053633v4 [Setaria viridis]|uniref:DUF7963 domain-containing protein n=1 Tax=Setaria italica TaxID=4555 RepID=K3Y5D6_SETIT|nr:uncharacterized protein LOC101777367 [Setaria italica]XP_034601834.1 uncharacterized protein LOC117862462 [Setaria viridis]
MSPGEGASAPPAVAPSSAGAMAAEEAAARKRYEALVQVRTKAVKGKGAWYWAHLEPVLVPPPTSGLPPKTARLRCALCAATFSASNPSRTASEHLKRGACPNFASPLAPVSTPPPPHHQQLAIASASSVVPIASFPPLSQRRHSTGGVSGGRKRHALAAAYAAVEAAAAASSQHVLAGEPAVYTSAPPTPPAPRQVLSGGRGDLGPLAQLEDSVRWLRSPGASPGPTLPHRQAEAALDLLSDWFLESAGGVSLAAVEHPKMKAFLRQVGLPELSGADLTRARLDARFAEASADAAARVRDARFFQLAADGWRDPVVTLAANLPNGTSVFHRAVPMPAPPSSDYAEEVLLDAVSSVAASADLRHCAGVVADRFGSKALRDLESKHPWMVNISCQVHCLTRLAKDMARELPLFHSAATNCAKMAAYFNTTATVRALLHRHQVQELGRAGLLRVAAPPSGDSEFSAALAMLDDVLTSARPLQFSVLEEPFKLLCIDDPAAREIVDMVHSAAFWAEVEAAHSLVKLITDMVKEMETERPLVGQCLPLWEDLRGKVRGWCRKFNVDEGIAMDVLERRFRKSYHPAWSAAFILDPLYLIKDASGRYLPPFKYLTPEQEKDMDRLITRLVSPEEAHLSMMELMKWRSEGLDPLYAQAVQVRQPDPATGKMKIANKQSSRLVWETCLSELKSLGKVAVRLIFLHATARVIRCPPRMARWLTASSGGIARAQRLVFVVANSKLERKDLTNDDDRDAEMLTDGDDDMMLADPTTTATVDPHR